MSELLVWYGMVWLRLVFDHVHIVSLSVLIVTHDRSRTCLSLPLSCPRRVELQKLPAMHHGAVAAGRRCRLLASWGVRFPAFRLQQVSHCRWQRVVPSTPCSRAASSVPRHGPCVANLDPMPHAQRRSGWQCPGPCARDPGK